MTHASPQTGPEGQAPRKRTKPPWLKVKLPTGEAYRKVRGLVSEHKLHTICESGNCPNMGECWGEGTATFMILGNVCTRSCGFCNVSTGRPEEVDPFEPGRVANSVKLMEVKHAVITSVDRDDLADGGAEIWAQTVRAIRHQSPGTTMETLIPDFAGKWENLQKIINVAPEVVSHNLETVRRLTKQVRIQAKYDRSLEVLMRLRRAGIRTKSGVMLGLGETVQEVETMEDLRSVDCCPDLGQYCSRPPSICRSQSSFTPTHSRCFARKDSPWASCSWRAARWCARATTPRSTSSEGEATGFMPLGHAGHATQRTHAGRLRFLD